MKARIANALCVALCAAGLALVATGCDDLSRGELNRGVEAVAALAAQGELIAAGVADDATKATYARVMAKTLGGQAEHQAEKLADAEPAPAVARERDTAVRVAMELADLFGELQVFPGDERRGARLVREMGAAQDAADAIVERLSGEPQ